MSSKPGEERRDRVSKTMNPYSLKNHFLQEADWHMPLGTEGLTAQGLPYYYAQVRVDYRVRVPLSLYVNDLLFLPGQLLTVFRPRVGIFYFFCLTL